MHVSVWSGACVCKNGLSTPPFRCPLSCARTRPVAPTPAHFLPNALISVGKFPGNKICFCGSTLGGTAGASSKLIGNRLIPSNWPSPLPPPPPPNIQVHRQISAAGLLTLTTRHSTTVPTKPSSHLVFSLQPDALLDRRAAKHRKWVGLREGRQGQICEEMGKITFAMVEKRWSVIFASASPPHSLPLLSLSLSLPPPTLSLSTFFPSLFSSLFLFSLSHTHSLSLSLFFLSLLITFPFSLSISLSPYIYLFISYSFLFLLSYLFGFFSFRSILSSVSFFSRSYLTSTSPSLLLLLSFFLHHLFLNLFFIFVHLSYSSFGVLSSQAHPFTLFF
ncbi:unnamed protein product [Acanthosepion pharaonis]|uniref:Uncharacterized protein n=1 Tax=Acanthosepion pharaonis TaxID=158019 RepID=A0A812DRY7_ACAPH|nr:unnamed protein product [Sepia pharaonis]